jgi:hypothetical protein
MKLPITNVLGFNIKNLKFSTCNKLYGQRKGKTYLWKALISEVGDRRRGPSGRVISPCFIFCSKSLVSFDWPIALAER